MKFYSQCGEDKILYEKYFKDKKNGVFLELGAMDGVIYSNTKFFEDTLGWSGVLIEPHPQMFRTLQQNRPNSKCYNCAISSRSGTVDMVINPHVPAVSTIDYTTSEQFMNVWHKNSYKVTVQTNTLSAVLKHAGVDHIDFFSLDVEGHEYDVLQSMDWSIPVHVLLVETLGLPNDDKVRKLLSENGFVYDGKCAHNEVWVHSSYHNESLQ
jgi:FkbM family methyltransferase